jgi:hypothetical protein
MARNKALRAVCSTCQAPTASTAPRMMASATNFHCHANHSHEPPNDASETMLSNLVDDLENLATEWEFNKGLGLVLHDLNRCPMCGEFTMHYSSAKAHLHPSHDTAYLARKKNIGRKLQEWIGEHRSHWDELCKSISHLQQILEGIHQEKKTACDALEHCHSRLDGIRLELEEAWQEHLAAKLSQCPWLSPSPSPWPHKLPHHTPPP